MVTNETKSRFLHDAIQEAVGLSQGNLLKKELKNLFLEDTNGGKLYKYRAFGKSGHALINLATQTLHCSRASAFNDPFDCRIGVDIETISSGIYEWNPIRIEELGTKCLKVISGEILLEDLCTTDQTVMNRVLSDNELVSFMKTVREKSFSSDFEQSQFLFEHSDMVFKTILAMIENTAYREQLMAASEAVPQMISQLTSEGKAVLADNPLDYSKFARANGINADMDQIGLMVQLIKQLDPASANAGETVEQEINGLIRKLAEELDNPFFVGSLCTSNKNKLMWSHYADSHKGFCIEYDFSKEEKLVPFPVFYTKDRVKMPWGIAVERTPENEKKASAEFMKALLTKDDVWAYENEWRLIVDSSSNQDVKMPPISCIYLGVSCSGENAEKVRKIAREMGIPVKQMSIDRGEYSLHVEEELF